MEELIEKLDDLRTTLTDVDVIVLGHEDSDIQDHIKKLKSECDVQAFARALEDGLVLGTYLHSEFPHYNSNEIEGMEDDMMEMEGEHEEDEMLDEMSESDEDEFRENLTDAELDSLLYDQKVDEFEGCLASYGFDGTEWKTVNQFLIEFGYSSNMLSEDRLLEFPVIAKVFCGELLEEDWERFFNGEMSDMDEKLLIVLSDLLAEADQYQNTLGDVHDDEMEISQENEEEFQILMEWYIESHECLIEDSTRHNNFKEWMAQIEERGDIDEIKELIGDLEERFHENKDPEIIETKKLKRAEFDFAEVRNEYQTGDPQTALEEIRFEQSQTDLIFNKSKFTNLIRELSQELEFYHDDGNRFDDEAIEALQTAAEDYLIGMFQGANELAIKEGNRTHIRPVDLQQALKRRR
tara:strand:- start:30086 stop:31309 length:1224 start_codon:yes stop_codon:yes gene_type:complete